MCKTPLKWFSSCLLVLVFWSQNQAIAGTTHCGSWSDADFAEDANQSTEFLNFVVDPSRFESDIPYTEHASEKPKVDRTFHFDQSANIRCKKLAVRNDKISVSEAAARFAESLTKFRGCGPEELKKMLAEQRKQFAEKSKVKARVTSSEEVRFQEVPEQVHRLNWASDFFEKTDGKILPFASGAKNGDENFGSALFKLKSRDGKTIIKRVALTSVSENSFCGSTPALERRLNALFDQEQIRLSAKQSDDGTVECLAWFSSSKEFNGKPAGTGLMAYLKIEPVSTSKFNFDPAYTESREEEIEGSNLKKLTLRPYQSEDRISVVRDPDGKLVTAELFTTGVRKSKFGNEQFFNKVVDFEYTSGRCAPKTIEYVETSGRVKVSAEACKEGGDKLSKLQTELSAFLKLASNQTWNRNPASKKSVTVADNRTVIKQFCDNFEFYLDR